MYYRNAQKVSADIAKAEEKVILQEYYQAHGVMPASRAEAELLEKESRRAENAAREATMETRRAEDKNARFIEESRRIGDQVSANLQRAEQQARYEAENKKQQLAQERRYQEAAERDRVEREMERFRAINNKADTANTP